MNADGELVHLARSRTLRPRSELPDRQPIDIGDPVWRAQLRSWWLAAVSQSRPE